MKRAKNIQNVQFHQVGRHMAYHILPTEIWTILSPPHHITLVGVAQIAACRPRLCPQSLGVLWLSWEVHGLLGITLGGWNTPWAANVLVAGHWGMCRLGAVAVSSQGSCVYAGILSLAGFAQHHAAAVRNSPGDMWSHPEGLSESLECARVQCHFWGHLHLLNVARVAV